MKSNILILLAVVLGFVSCENQDITFDDYGTTGVYFPFQTPARTLILGKYDVGLNDNDNKHRFEIGVNLGGVQQNKKDRLVYFELATDLMDDVLNVSSLPSNYYEIVTESPVTIPAGSHKGRITVQLTDAFFKDAKCFAPEDSVCYAIPLVITDALEVDTIHRGEAALSTGEVSRLNDKDWTIKPKDYTLFGIKFINKYHAMYLRRGVDEMTNSSGATVESVYRNEYVERDELVMLTTTGEKSVELSNIVRRGSENSPGSVNFELLFDDAGDCSIQSFGDDAYNVTGSGKYVEDSETWGGKMHDAIILDYSYTDASNNETHRVKDTLVVRDRGVIFEEFSLLMTE